MTKEKAIPSEVIDEPLIPHWMRGFLMLAAIYNLIWGIFIYNFPEAYFTWITAKEPTVIDVVQYQGLGVLLFAGVFLTAAIYPFKVWYMLWAGVAAKLFGGILVFYLIMETEVTKKFIFHLIMNDLVWVGPLFIIALKVTNARKCIS
jgi:hypothetical protein